MLSRAPCSVFLSACAAIESIVKKIAPSVNRARLKKGNNPCLDSLPSGGGLAQTDAGRGATRNTNRPTHAPAFRLGCCLPHTPACTVAHQHGKDIWFSAI